MHDAFQFSTDVWGGFMRGCPDISLDTHIYQGWNNPGDAIDFFVNACGQKTAIAAMEVHYRLLSYTPPLIHSSHRLLLS
jgi:glucan 1,3-beta-glucosidase